MFFLPQEFHLLAGKLEQQCKDVETADDSRVHVEKDVDGGGVEGGGGRVGGGASSAGGSGVGVDGGAASAGGDRKRLMEKTRREMLEAANLALQVLVSLFHCHRFSCTIRCVVPQVNSKRLLKSAGNLSSVDENDDNHTNIPMMMLTNVDVGTTEKYNLSRYLATNLPRSHYLCLVLVQHYSFALAATL